MYVLYVYVYKHTHIYTEAYSHIHTLHAYIFTEVYTHTHIHTKAMLQELGTLPTLPGPQVSGPWEGTPPMIRGEPRTFQASLSKASTHHVPRSPAHLPGDLEPCWQPCPLSSCPQGLQSAGQSATIPRTGRAPIDPPSSCGFLGLG